MLIHHNIVVVVVLSRISYLNETQKCHHIQIEIIKQSHSAETPHLNFHVHHFDTSRDTSRLIVQLQETELRFDQFYEEHSKELHRCLELRRFEGDFRELQVSFEYF